MTVRISIGRPRRALLSEPDRFPWGVLAVEASLAFGVFVLVVAVLRWVS